MNFSEYKETEITLYKDFTKLIRRLLKPKISETEYNLHTIQTRTKTSDSLRKKLIKINLLSSNTIEQDIKDLAGCRIIFYLNSDVQKFMSSGIVEDIFKVTKETYKIHHPKDEIQSSNDFYMAEHFVIELSESLLRNSQYSKFQGLRCEIQVCTILNHAYAAMNHKIYKKPEITGFASEEFQNVEKRLIFLAENHIIQAGYEFQKIYDDLQNLSTGKSIHERQILKEVSSSVNNNERYTVLHQFRKYTLPYYDDINGEFPKIMDIVGSSLHAAKKPGHVIINTLFGSFSEKNISDIFSECLEILDYVRYVDPEKIFTKYLEIYDDPEYSDKKHLLSKIKNLVTFNYEILEKAGYFVQDCLCSYIDRFEASATLKFKPIIIEVCKSILMVDYERTIFDNEFAYFSDINLPGSSRLMGIREKAIDFLKNLSTLSPTDIERNEIFKVLILATRKPSARNYDNELLLIILKNSFDIVVFYLETASHLSFELTSLIETSFFSIYEFANSTIEKIDLPAEILLNAKILKEKLLEFSKCINKNDQYIIFKTLVGYGSVFKSEWTKKPFSFEQRNFYRSEKINKFITLIHSNNREYWTEIIVRCSKPQSEDRSTLSYYVQFLELLGKLQPEFSYELISENQEMSNFIGHLVVGLIDSNLKDATLKLTTEWISEGKYLDQLVWAHRRTKCLDDGALVQILNTSIESKDIFVLKHLISAVIEIFDNTNMELIKRVVIPSITNLTVNKDASWITAGLINPNKANVFFNAMDSSDIDLVLENLIYTNSIDYLAELVLLPIANRYPKKVLAFFGERLTHKPIDGNRYNRLPYTFTLLGDSLASCGDLILDVATIWYRDNEKDFKHNGARFIKLIFPNFNRLREQSLQEFLQKNFDLYLPMVLSILENYSGELFLYDTCKKIVVLLPDESLVLNKIQSVMLGQSNIISTSGEFGLTEFYKDKKIQILTWINDDDPKIKKFAKKLLQTVDNNIALEKRRAEQNIALRNRK